MDPHGSDLSGGERGPRSSNGAKVNSPDAGPPAGFTAGYYWKTRANLFGLPLVCIAFGSDPQGKTRVAKGFLAIGQFAVGVITLAQFGVGIVGIGQFAFGVAAVGQLALGMLAGFGQISIGMFAVGQIVAGTYGMGQMGWATYMWSPERTDMEAVSMFHSVTWLFQQGPSTVLDAAKFGLKLLWSWAESFFK
ncbi:MAG: hypothetical protein V1792_00545 [Pseudomonadota bacterium]